MPPRRPSNELQKSLGAYWAVEHAALLRQLDSNDAGLSSRAAADRLRRFGRNEIKQAQRLSRLLVLWKQLRSPLLFLLLFAAVVSLASRAWTDASSAAWLAIARFTYSTAVRRD